MNPLPDAEERNADPRRRCAPMNPPDQADDAASPSGSALPNDRRTGDPRNGATSHRRGALERPVTASEGQKNDSHPSGTGEDSSTDGDGMPSSMIIEVRQTIARV